MEFKTFNKIHYDREYFNFYLCFKSKDYQYNPLLKRYTCKRQVVNYLSKKILYEGSSICNANVSVS